MKRKTMDNPTGNVNGSSIDDELSDEQHKRRRLVYGSGDATLESLSSTGITTNSSSSTFLEFHLKLLKYLYVDQDEPESQENVLSLTSTSTSQTEQPEISKLQWDDGPVDPAVFTMTQAFLRQREGLAESRKEAVRLQGIDQEARLFMGMGASSSSSSRAANFKATSPSRPLRRLHSPVLAPTYASPTSSKSKPSAASFGIISRLLHRQFQNARTSFQLTVDPFVPLQQQAQDLTKTLGDMLQVHKSTKLAKDQAAANELLGSVMRSQGHYVEKNDIMPPSPCARDKSRLAKLETKLKLWTLLTQDLKREIH